MLIVVNFLPFHRFGYECRCRVGVERIVCYVLSPALLFISMVAAKYSLEDDGGLLLARAPAGARAVTVAINVP